MYLNRIFFVTSVTHCRRTIFNVERNANLFIDVLYHCREEEDFQLHAFVLMPEHFHLLITPADTLSLEKCMQFVKGRFSYRLHSRLSVWQPSFTNHHVRDEADFQNHVEYIHGNPVERRLVRTAADFLYSSANPRFQVDPIPQGLKPLISNSATRA